MEHGSGVILEPVGLPFACANNPQPDSWTTQKLSISFLEALQRQTEGRMWVNTKSYYKVNKQICGTKHEQICTTKSNNEFVVQKQETHTNLHL